MKHGFKTLLMALLMAAITVNAGTNGTPLLRPFLQTDFNGNGQAGTNFNNLVTTNATVSGLLSGSNANFNGAVAITNLKATNITAGTINTTNLTATNITTGTLTATNIAGAITNIVSLFNHFIGATNGSNGFNLVVGTSGTNVTYTLLWPTNWASTNFVLGQGFVTNINGISNNVTLVAGANVTLTPSGHNITIASSGGGGGGGSDIFNAAQFFTNGAGQISVVDPATVSNLVTGSITIPDRVYGGYPIQISGSSSGFHTAWIDIPTSGPSGIGSGGPGANAWIAYVAEDGQWFGSALAGDIAFRNGNRLLFGAGGGDAQVILDGITTTLQPNGGSVIVGGATSANLNVTGSLTVAGTVDGNMNHRGASFWMTDFVGTGMAYVSSGDDPDGFLVVGDGTSFTTELSVGDFVVPDPSALGSVVFATVASITDDTHFTIADFGWTNLVDLDEVSYTVYHVNAVMNGGGYFSQYARQPTALSGVPYIVANSTVTGRTNQSLYTGYVPSTDGYYRVTFIADITRPGSSSSTLGPCWFNFKSAADGAFKKQTNTTFTTTLNTTNVSTSATITAYCQANQTFICAIDQATSGTTNMQYNAEFIIEKLSR